jgi:CheY-like chemotaxis protein
VLPTGRGRILYVDDEKALVDFSQQMLERCGYTVSPFTSSLEALDVFRFRPREFDLVITDLTMPGLTGLDLAVEIRKVRPDIPVLLTTGFSEAITREKAAKAGIREILTKPATVKDLGNAVQRALSSEDANQGRRKPRSRILVVDDDDQVRQMLCQTLEMDGYDVEGARNGKEAMKGLGLRPVDLVVTDLFMPEKDGMETIMELRKISPKTRIIAISGGWRTGPNEYLHVAMRLGAGRALSKPIEREVLLQAIRELLDQDVPECGHENNREDALPPSEAVAC